jgi:ABC-type tungstate transport system permease subunit
LHRSSKSASKVLAHYAGEPAKHLNQNFGQQFIEWLVSQAGQQAITNYGEQLFFPNAIDPNA